MKNLVSQISMTALLALAVSGFAACSSEDKAPPSLVAANFVDMATGDSTSLGVADVVAPIDSISAETSTLGTVQLVFSELLDGESVMIITRDPDTGDVSELVGREGLVRIAPADGSVVDSLISSYSPSDMTINVDLPPKAYADRLEVAYLPAEGAIAVNIMGDRIRDKAGNLIPTATDPATGEPIRDADGRGIAATTAFATVAIAMTGTEIAEYGLPDDPDTSDVDESMPSSTVTFNTGIDASTAADYISIVPVGFAGATIPVTVEALVADDTGDLPLLDPATLVVTPTSPPLAGAFTYALKIESGLTDVYGVPYGADTQLIQFVTAE